MLPAVCRMIAPRRVPLPTLPDTEIAPLPEVISKGNPPSTVCKEMAPLPVEVSSFVLAVSVMPELRLEPKVMAAKTGVALVVMTFPARETLPDPFCKKGPFEVIVLPAVVVKVPLLVIVMGPVLEVVTLSKKVIVAAVKLMPEGPLTLRAPLNVLLLLPVRTIEEAVMACAESVPEQLIVSAFNKLQDPANVRLLTPDAVRDKLPGPSAVPFNVTPPPVKDPKASKGTTTGPWNCIVLVDVIEEERFVDAAPTVCEKVEIAVPIAPA